MRSRPPHRHAFGLALLLSVGILNAPLLAQSETDASPAPPQGASESQPNAAGSTSSISDVGVPYSTLFKPTTAPIPGINNYEGPTTQLGAQAQSENFSGHFTLQGLRYRTNTSFLTSAGFAPERAHLKLGPVYFRVEQLRGIVGYRNIDGERRSRDDWFALTQLSFTLMVRPDERFSFALQGHVFYYPFDNRVRATLTGGPLPGALAALGLFPSFHGQVAYTTMLGEWPVTLADDLRYSRARYSDSVGYNISNTELLTYDSDRDGEDGAYTFGRVRGRETNRTRDALSDDFSVLSNTASISTRRELPGAWDFWSRLYRQDLWYYPDLSGLPRAREGLNVSVISTRENLRFKPFARYGASHIDGRDGIDQRLEIGATGPITDLLRLTAVAGYFWTTVKDSNSTATGKIRLDHTAGPNTTESLQVERSISEFNDQIIDRAGYWLHQVLGPQVQASFFATYGRYTANQRNIISSDQCRVGVTASYQPSTRTDLTSTSYYSWIDRDDSMDKAFTEELIARYRFNDSISTQTLYRYRINSGTGRSQDYTEHLAIFSIQKTF